MKIKRNPKERALDWLAFGILGAIAAAIIAALGIGIVKLVQELIVQYQEYPDVHQKIDESFALLLTGFVIAFSYRAAIWALERIGERKKLMQASAETEGGSDESA